MSKVKNTAKKQTVKTKASKQKVVLSSNKEPKTKALSSLEKIIKKALSSKEFQEIQKLITSLNKAELQTRKYKRESIARTYCHLGDLFDEVDFEKGSKLYLLSLFPQSNDKEQNSINQSYRNKYQRAFRFLREEKVPFDRDKVLKKIEKVGLQALFNGKQDNEDDSDPKNELNTKVKHLMSSNDPKKIIKQVLKIATNQSVKNDFVICCANGKLCYSVQSEWANKLISDNRLTELSLTSKK